MGEIRGRYQAYDHNLKSLAFISQNPSLFKDFSIPDSTIREWMRSEPTGVVSHSAFDLDGLALQARLIELEQKNAELESKLELMAETQRIFEWSPEYERLPEPEKKSALLSLVDRALARLPLGEVLETVRISSARFHSWKKKERGCNLEDYSSCPKSNPTQLMASEVKAIEEMVTDKDLAHFTLTGLVLHAMRIGRVSASMTTWRKVIKQKELKRPRERVHPESNKVGIRADQPNELWHVDVTIIRLLNGMRAYIQVIMDNFSRYLLAWSVSDSIGGLETKKLLQKALQNAVSLDCVNPPCLICDSGVENVNGDVQELIDDGFIVRKIAQIEIVYSNSMSEAFNRSLKHNHLFLRELSSLPVLCLATFWTFPFEVSTDAHFS